MCSCGSIQDLANHQIGNSPIGLKSMDDDTPLFAPLKDKFKQAHSGAPSYKCRTKSQKSIKNDNLLTLRNTPALAASL